MSLPPFRAFVFWVSGVERRLAPETFEARIATLAEELIGNGYSGISALAAAEAVLLATSDRRFDRIELHEDDPEGGGSLVWWGVYETDLAPPFHKIRLPLWHATTAHRNARAGIILN